MTFEICTSILEESAEDCINSLKGLKFAEVRMDGMVLTIEKARMIFSQPLNLIATHRGKENEKKALLLAAIEAGAKFVDVEVDSSDGYKKDVIRKAREHRCKVIVSYHNSTRTPKTAELEQIVEWCFESGADIAKVACKVNSERDNARLLSLLDSENSIVVVGMGEKGRVTRVVAPLLGSPFTFASVSKGKETAEGQLTAGEIKKVLGELV